MGSSFSTLNSQEEFAFSRFVDLPGELQNQIWEYALPPPRIVRLTYYPGCGWEMSNVSEFNQPIESLKYACRSSNSFCRNYKLYREVVCEGGRISRWKKAPKGQKKQDLWFNPTYDSIFIDYEIPAQAVCELKGYLLNTSPDFPHCYRLCQSRILWDVVNITFSIWLWLWWDSHRLVIRNGYFDYKRLLLDSSPLRRIQST